jgi:hypothetical protein
MGTFKDRINYSPHNFNTFRLSFTYDGETVNATGLNTFAVETNNDEVVSEVAGDGVGLFQEETNISGFFEFELIEADVTNAWLWDRVVNGDVFSVSGVDSNQADLEVKGGQCRVKKKPRIEKKKEVSYITWTVETIYLDVKSGGYALVSA